MRTKSEKPARSGLVVSQAKPKPSPPVEELASASIAVAPQERSLAASQPAQELEVLREISRAIGTRSEQLSTLLLNQAFGTVAGPQDRSAGERLGTTLAALQGIAPRDEIEGMLAVQLVALHNVAMDQLCRAAHPDQFPASSDSAVNTAARLLRAFAQQLEDAAGLRCRRGGGAGVTSSQAFAYRRVQALREPFAATVY